jgi:hypothetical protein
MSRLRDDPGHVVNPPLKLIASCLTTATPLALHVTILPLGQPTRIQSTWLANPLAAEPPSLRRHCQETRSSPGTMALEQRTPDHRPGLDEYLRDRFAAAIELIPVLRADEDAAVLGHIHRPGRF